ncbi:aminotransferase class I/II-fold pyridoxal phosphate-dependent enzyme [Pseudobowmanella zhangzhouensis]|uniref:aminotransferase class I/II-fold pyridoxal phosphate-dependent enzyme n=1 Tax=Pseudobowmanella zhangzhouensis TaxID=1537679 RepID=UPI003613E75E
MHAVDLVKSDAWRRTALQQNIAHFRHRAELAGLKLMPSDSAIQPIVVGDNQRVMTIASMLKQNGFLVGAMRSPTVSKGTERLRITLNALHNHNEINQLIEKIGKAWTA